MTNHSLPLQRGRDPALVGLCGRAGTGKSAAAAYLEDRHRFACAAFAEEIKDMLALHLDSLGIDYAHLEEPALKNSPLPGLGPGADGITARLLMQTLGDWGRALHPNWWVYALAHRMGLQASPGGAARPAPVHDRICIVDVRYPNEAAWLLEQGGVLIRLHREGAAPVRSHSSEQHIDALPAHIDLVNNGPTLHGLHSLLDGALAAVGLDATDA